MALGTSLVAVAIALAKSPYAWAIPYITVIALIFYGWALFLAVIHRREEKLRSGAANENRLENFGNPTQTQHVENKFEFGEEFLNKLTPQPSFPEPKPLPQVELISCEPTMIYYDRYWVEANPVKMPQEKWKNNSEVARFRIRPSPAGNPARSAHGVTAHLTYRNAEGGSQIVDYGTWLDKYEHKVDFRGNSHALILCSTVRAGKDDDGQTYVFDNPHSFNIFDQPYRSNLVIRAPKEKLFIADCTEVEVEIRNFESTLFHRNFKRLANGWKLE